MQGEKMSEIQHRSEGKIGSFYLEINGKRLATMSYIMSDDSNMIVDHTKVDPSLKGQGIGKKLIKELVDFARKKQIKVKPLCSFVAAVLNKTPEWQDILD
jgi:predicted GNAT family acetyltransferase